MDAQNSQNKVTTVKNSPVVFMNCTEEVEHTTLRGEVE